MARKLIITEESAKKIAKYELLREAANGDVFNSKEFKDAIKSALKNDRDISKETEKMVKQIVSDCISELFKSLWQRNNFWTTAIKNS